MRTWRRTACNRDCPDACTLEVAVEEGRAVALRGAKDDPVTRGFLCERTSRFLWRQDHPERLTRPLLREAKGGALVPVSWEHALEHAAERLLAARDSHGPASILHYRSGGSLGLLKVLADLFFERFGPTSTKHGDVCSGAGEAAQEQDFGISESNDLFDLLHARTIVLWGKDPHTSNVHLLPVLQEARERGARLVGIELRRTKAAALCDLWITPRPGGDQALALGVARLLFERGAMDPQAAEYAHGVAEYRALCFSRSVDAWARAAGVELPEMLAFADLYGTPGPSAILVGWGMGRRANGAAIVRALDALATVSGNMGVSGGGCSFYFARRRAFDQSFLAGPSSAPRTLSEPLLGEAILAARDPGIEAIWITAGNPVAMLPDSLRVREALRRTPFVVVVDTHPTDTTELADMVLPTCTLLEDDDLLGAYGNHWLRVSEPAVAPAGEARHELAILQGLAAAIDRRDPRAALGTALSGTPEDWKRRLLARCSAAGVGLEDLRRGPVRSPFAAPVVHAGRRFATADGRADLRAQAFVPPALPTAERPLLLLAVSTPKTQSSQRTAPLPADPLPRAGVHPSAAAGLADGAEAILESARGSLRVRLVHRDDLRPEVVHLDKGGALGEGRCANLLVHARETDAGAGAAYYDEPVRILPC